MPAILSCIRCNQILNEGEKFCHLCGGLGAVSQNVRQMPEQKRDTAPRAQDEQSIVTYWPWLFFYSLLFYLASLSIGISITMNHRMGLARRLPISRPHVNVEPFTSGNFIVAIFLIILGFVLLCVAFRIMASRELKNASIGECRMAVILTTSLITFFTWFFLEIDSQTINRLIIPVAILTIFLAMVMPKMKLPEDDFND